MMIMKTSVYHNIHKSVVHMEIIIPINVMMNLSKFIERPCSCLTELFEYFTKRYSRLWPGNLVLRHT